MVQKIIIPPSSENFFKENFDVSNEDFEQIYSMPFKATIYTKLRAFQFKINHNILYTNEKLYRIKISESPLCSLCDDKTETSFCRLLQSANNLEKSYRTSPSAFWCHSFNEKRHCARF